MLCGVEEFGRVGDTSSSSECSSKRSTCPGSSQNLLLLKIVVFTIIVFMIIVFMIIMFTIIIFTIIAFWPNFFVFLMKSINFAKTKLANYESIHHPRLCRPRILLRP